MSDGAIYNDQRGPWSWAMLLIAEQTPSMPKPNTLASSA